MNVALYYDPDGYLERPGVKPAGIMGRRVAGHEFLDAYLTHGRWDTLTAVVRTRDWADTLAYLCRTHPSSRTRTRRLRVVTEVEYPGRASEDPAARLLAFPCPPDERFAWARRTTGCAFALYGVTHTLATPTAVKALCGLLTAPLEPFDALVCTSGAVADLVRAVTGGYADYLRDRFGGDPVLRIRLEVIPLGVNPEKYRPTTADERAARRADLQIAADEVVVLCVGRLSHHAKSHPFPLFQACDRAARWTGAKIHLVMAGWAARPVVDQAFRAGARYFAPACRVSFVDGQDPAVRAGVWHAADVFASLPDNLQETFGLVVVEAMATGLPVLGSDWNGYRDLIADGETGFLVPTRMVLGATAGATVRLLLEQTTYDQFLAECCQVTVVDPEAAASALARLVADAELRRRMGAAGRQRVVERFSWERVIRAYEHLWAEQVSELEAWSATRPPAGPLRYPPPERSFAGYPSAWLTDAELVVATDGATGLTPLLNMPLTNLAANRRCRDPVVVTEVLRIAATPQPIGALALHLERAGTDPESARATLAWLLKYGLLRVTQPPIPPA